MLAGSVGSGACVVARHRSLEVLWVFLLLGLSSFGGPVAHLARFQMEFVERRRWLDAAGYADLVALCQFLPGPTSSQVGIALGWHRNGWSGALAAWTGFTAPSALLMIALGYGLAGQGNAVVNGALQGLKVVAVAIVIQAVWSMARSLCPDRSRGGLAIAAALVALAWPGPGGQIAAMVFAGLAGYQWLRPPELAGEPRVSTDSTLARRRASPRLAALACLLFVLALLGLPLLASLRGASSWAVIDGFFRAGALIFGGGHVMLPLLQTTVVPAGLLDNDAFLSGYGAAQALPGPLLAFAAYLGTAMVWPQSGWLGGVLCLLAVFVPSFLLIAAVLPYWQTLGRRMDARRTLAGINAGVVGLLLAALYDPVWVSAIEGRRDFALALAGVGLLMLARWSPVYVVALGAFVGALFAGS